jgi:hypothetical protein
MGSHGNRRVSLSEHIDDELELALDEEESLDLVGEDAPGVPTLDRRVYFAELFRL